MKTLIIVDAQIDFMPGGALEVKGGDRIIPVINEILPHFELVVATQDWHPANHKSFAVNHSGKNVFEVIELNGLEQKLWPPHCVQGTKGADFHPALETKPVEAIFRKGMDPEIDSYSGLYDNGYKKSTGLSGYLEQKGASDLYFCGLAADICVYFSLLDALKEGFNATLIEDAAVPLLPKEFESIRKDIIKKGGKIINSKDL
ncbi:bifunctional nicotinamidase/pyrazinamidase [Salinimicrobium sediminilitoris]|uniref:bifunctional nicotinamidase/pyrazinamidase n=1 Tax=Salinimicrobium sediminilitoris TaxID=2876715 RepID=UPI001E353925|nr:bifunctional nicotinamidase/pyrazinamidase [Salinimicrobium sediminilitoris]MCC8360232.1 bifunctional nicotinamidase/pyrazinamidase [Salinimicrobium sediminilitoris]